MQFKEWLFNEMPINRFELIGDWGPKSAKRGWDDKSHRLLTSEKAVQKIRNQWSRSPVDFDMYFVRQAGAQEYLEIGEVSLEWVKDKLNYKFEPNEDAITIFFTQNRGDQKVPMTAWIIGHRFGHALESGGRGRGRWTGATSSSAGELYKNFEKQVYTDLQDLAQNVYRRSVPNYKDYSMRQKGIMHKIAQALGTMKSAREGNLRDFGEFVHELLGQYILEGRVKFNSLPRTLGTRYAWGNPYAQFYSGMHSNQEDQEDLNDQVQQMASNYNYWIREILEHAKGSIFVM
jgi:hypothetical protein